jgi:hypothetical protein
MPPGGIRTHNLNRRAATDLRLRPRGHWDLPYICTRNKPPVGQCSQYSNSLRTGRSGDRILVGASFSALVRIVTGAYPAYFSMGTLLFQGVKRLGCGANHPPPSSAEVKERVELYLFSFCVPSWSVLG